MHSASCRLEWTVKIHTCPTFWCNFCLEISNVELHVSENNTEHRTDEISIKRLIVRRGQSFQITLDTSRQFRPETDALLFTVETGMFMFRYFLE